MEIGLGRPADEALTRSSADVGGDPDRDRQRSGVVPEDRAHRRGGTERSHHADRPEPPPAEAPRREPSDDADRLIAGDERADQSLAGAVRDMSGGERGRDDVGPGVTALFEPAGAAVLLQ
jgi:hypothetical protein